MGKFIVDESTANTLVRVWEDETAQLSFQQQVVSKMPILDDATSQIRVVFDGIDDHMIGALPSPISTDDCTLIYVGKATLPESGVGVICSFYDADPANDFYYVRFGSIDGVPTCWYGNGVDTEVTLQATGMDFTADLDYEWAFTADPVSGERTFWVDGVEKETSTTELSATINNVQLGANGDNNYTVSEAGAVVSYSVFKTSSELSDIDTYLFDRYGLDTEAPTVGDTTVSTSNITSSSFDIAWNKAIDNNTDQTNIRYRVYSSESNNITTYEDAQANGTLLDTLTDENSYTVNVGSSETTRWVNVFALDEKNNVLSYTSVSETTASGITVSDTDAQALVDQMETESVGITQTRADLIDTLYQDLKTGITNGTNVYAKLDRLYIFNGENLDQCLFDLTNPTRKASLRSPVRFNFHPNECLALPDSTSTIDPEDDEGASRVDPSFDVSESIIGNASFGAVYYGIYHQDNSGYEGRSSNNSWSIRYNNVNIQGGSGVDGFGHAQIINPGFSVLQANVDVTEKYYDGSPHGTPATGETFNNNASGLYFLGNGNSFSTTGEISLCFVGEAFTDNEAVDFFEAVDKFMVAVGTKPA